ncbi:hypothetical protein QH494_11295 [Sphingomonas sp. AR_OL41]|uniref:hypothetical protein n=1 Tax=Sphingomonas sp. AR_OL41 TaxID=3042729 RepID=UPI00247FD0C7|nr:hypothetical protein [Sphingomonas sp. AR_OL41]MDH7972765.1 hypothetical protein [Sphingomonas sp. AR_OL41]MDH7972771.1 hypothetical protein [Sphingomonas sp. AR_OL41]
MKWLGATINALALLVLAALVTAYIQPIIKYIMPEKAIQATINLNMWMEKPAKVGFVEEKPSNDLATNQSNHDIYMSPDYYKFADMELTNTSEKTITDIRFRLEDGQRPDVMIVTDDGNKRWYVTGKNDIHLPDMKPGDKTKVYMWASGLFSKLIITDLLSTYSSGGPFDIAVLSPQEKDFYSDKHPISDSLGSLAGWVGGVGAVLLGVIFCIMNIFYEKYYKKLLADPVFLVDEKARYDLEPAKFVPKL